MTTKPTDADIIKALDWCEQVEDNVLLSDVKATKFTFALQSLQTIKQVLKDYNRLKAENEEVRKDIVTAEKYAWQLKAKNEALQMDNEQLKSDIINERMNLEHIQAENEALISAQETMQKHIEKAKAEAIKEFAERLKEKCFTIPTVYNPHFGMMVDNLVKEMVGDTE